MDVAIAVVALPQFFNTNAPAALMDIPEVSALTQAPLSHAWMLAHCLASKSSKFRWISFLNKPLRGRWCAGSWASSFAPMVINGFSERVSSGGDDGELSVCPGRTSAVGFCVWRGRLD